MVVSLLKVKAWIVAHWNWLVLVGLFCLAYLLGNKSSASLLAQANIAKEQYKDDNKELERLHGEKQVRDNKIEVITEKVEKALQDARDKELEQIEETHVSPDDAFQDLGITKK
tara:strand:- start:4 stop:342 length:339 start_codon:yes stop_codon:yes gene_type:complete